MTNNDTLQAKTMFESKQRKRLANARIEAEIRRQEGMYLKNKGKEVLEKLLAYYT